jgi:hypothetical protein
MDESEICPHGFCVASCGVCTAPIAAALEELEYGRPELQRDRGLLEAVGERIASDPDALDRFLVALEEVAARLRDSGGPGESLHEQGEAS